MTIIICKMLAFVIVVVFVSSGVRSTQLSPWGMPDLISPSESLGLLVQAPSHPNMVNLLSWSKLVCLH